MIILEELHDKCATCCDNADEWMIFHEDDEWEHFDGPFDSYNDYEEIPMHERCREVVEFRFSRLMNGHLFIVCVK